MKSRLAPHLVDFYKFSHADMFPKGLTAIYGNFTMRSDRLLTALPDFDHKPVWFGAQGVLQYLLIEDWNDTFFNADKAKVLAKMQRRSDKSLGPGRFNAQRWGALHDLGYLPLEIKTIDEGNRVNIRVAPFTIEATLPEFAWLSQYLETQLSAELWDQPTDATIAYEYRRLLNRYAAKSGADMNFVPWQGHDFSARGRMGTSGAFGAGHLLSFTGTDTVSAIDYLEQYYPDEDVDAMMVGGSIPATEHAVSSSNIILIAQSLRETGSWNGWSFDELNPTGRADVDLMLVAETAFLRYVITELYPTGPVSYVADTYDFWAVISIIAPFLKPYIMARGADELGRPGTVVFRPDSGKPKLIICGDAAASDPVIAEGAVRNLYSNFPGTTNSMGFKTLDSHVGLIYGDSITLNLAAEILAELVDNLGFVSTSTVLGIGSFTYQFVTRDTLGTAMKATFGTINGKDYNFYKDPKTDAGGMKKSARGLILVEKQGNDFVQFDCQTREQASGGELKTRFLNGRMLNMQTLTEIRTILNAENAR